MSDDQVQPGADTQNQDVAPGELGGDAAKQEHKTFDESYVKKLRDEAAAYRVKLKEFEDRDKSAADKAAERIAELERENTRYKHRDEVQSWASEIAKDEPSIAPLLRGSTREELEEHFNQIKSLTVKPTPKASPAGKSPADRDKPTTAAEALRALRKG